MHGWGGSQASLKCLADKLQNEFTVTLVDFYGYGATPLPLSPLKLNDYTNAIVDIINHYKMQSAIVIGHSFGGRVCLQLAKLYPHLVDKIVLIDSAGIKPKRSILYYIRVLRHKILKKLHIKHTAGSSDYRALSSVMQQTFVNIVNYDLSPYLKYIITKTLIIWGARDRDTPIYMAKRLKRSLTNSELVILKDAGHFSYLDNKNECLYYIKQFIGGD